ncbi:MAG: hypothetical protein NTX86_05070 [Candidatus Dependentiae bacterium]|nr:hypothetical protein [Candidatus Dependentiae bacterium]
MAHATQHSLNENNALLSPQADHALTPPAQLWIGSHDFLVEHTELYLQKFFCAQQGCQYCTACTQIRDRQHHAVRWVKPEKNYTLDELSIIFNTIAYALNPDEHFFFVLQKADFLTLTCANSLLKSLEEPPAGYHFILLAERQEPILPTIRSRCIVHSFNTSAFNRTSALFDFFTTTKAHNPSIFLAALEQSKITERDSIELLDALFAHWLAICRSAVIENEQMVVKESYNVITKIQQAITMPPMPGSSKIFWKNLFLQIKKL